MIASIAPPLPSMRMLRVVHRNYMVWRKLAWTSIATHAIEPAIALFALGLGIGAMIGSVDGGSYIVFVASAMAAYSAVNSASFEGLYSAFTRMHVQRTWESILCAPMQLDDVLLAEWLWAGTKALLSSTAVLLMVVIFGYVSPLGALLSLPITLLTGLALGGIALCANAISRGYEFFSYFFTLFVTPMVMLSGLFFPRSVMPEALQLATAWLPMTLAVDILRPLSRLDLSLQLLAPAAGLAAYACGGMWLAAYLTRRRLLT